MENREVFMRDVVWAGFVVGIVLAICGGAGAAEELVRFDFETGDLQGWQAVEGQFDRLISDRAVYHNHYHDQPSNRYNKQGKYYLSTVEQMPGMPSNDRMTGVVESPVFTLTGPDMSMLDRHCARCHDFGTPAGKKLNLAGDRSICFNASYEELWRKGYLTCVGAGPAEIQPAYSWGSHPSKLIQELPPPGQWSRQR